MAKAKGKAAKKATKQVAAYFNDRWTVSDALDFEDYRVALEQIILNADTPMTIGVFGPWGSGKTSLLKMLEGGIKERGRGYRVRPVWFTAWKYNQQEALWRAFLLRVIDSLYPKDERTGARLAGEKITDDSQKKGVKALDRMAASLYQQVVWNEESGWALNRSELGLQFAKIPAALLFHLAGQGKLAEEWGIDPKFAEVIERESREFHLNQLESMEQFEETFERAVTLMLGEEGRLVVFVDDLDRCLPEKALEVLEAIKLFLNVKQTVFVLGMDREIVARGIEQHYREFFLARAEDGQRAELPVTGDAYLQKLVQVPVNLPLLEKEGRREFIQKLEKGQPEELRMDDLTREVFARGLLPIPRQVKRALNIYGLLKTVALQREEREATPEAMQAAWPLLAKTVLIQSQWPEFYALWRQWPTLVQTLESQYIRRPTTEEDIVYGLTEELTGPEPGIDKPDAETPPEAKERSRPARPIQQTGILAQFLNERAKYRLLEQLLTYPPSSEEGEGRLRARFAGLSYSQLQAYLGLAGSVEAEAAVEQARPERVEARGLDSDDPALLREQAARLLDAGGKDPEESRAQVRKNLLYTMANPGRIPAARAEAGNLLAELGDPRFDADFHYLPKGDLLGFIKIPAGKFWMGSDPKEDPEASEDERPKHESELREYYIARWPVTAAQYRAFVKASGHETSNEDSLRGVENHPVTEVSWRDARAYCDWLHDILAQSPDTPEELKARLVQGWRVTLPSEAEWEKAARGTDGRIYPWGPEFDSNRANTAEARLGTTSAVGCFPGGRSPFGVEDLSGNVWEWTRSKWVGEKAYPYPQGGKALAEREDLNDKGVARVLRGGSFSNGARVARCACRGWTGPVVGNWNGGFRGVVSPLSGL